MWTQIQAMTCSFDGQWGLSVGWLLLDIKMKHGRYGKPEGWQVAPPGLSSNRQQSPSPTEKVGRRSMGLSHAQPTSPPAFLLCFLWLMLTDKTHHEEGTGATFASSEAH